MWILECDGDILHHKRTWLRPGKKYLFGRTKSDGTKYAGIVISNKSISRKHLTLAVAAVKSGEGSQVHARSEIIVEDEQTKIGTEIDGQQIRGQKRILKSDVHVLRLGNYEHLFRIKWQPVVLSFTFPSKETKGGKDPLIPVRGRLEDLNVKAIVPYLINKTTHVVATKRNTAKCLQALINGKYIVDNSFIDALVYVTTPGNLDEPESLSPLEEDFDGNWPDALGHLPQPGKEPGQRPNELFAPNPDRGHIFEGYTFVFCSQRQIENLQAPITNGGGKALFCDVRMGQTTPDDVVRYMKDAAGEKGVGEFEDGSVGPGVVLVRFQGDKGFEDWAIELQHDVALTLNHRLIEQNEFLDAILVNDPSKLRRPLPEEIVEDSLPLDAEVAPTSSRTVETISEQQTIQRDASQTSVRRGRLRGTIVSAFKGFDDEFDRTLLSTERKPTGTGLQTENTQNGNLNSHSCVESQIEMDSDASHESTTRSRNPKKRPPPSDSEEDDMSEKLLPAAAAMKRRRIEKEKEARQRGVSADLSSSRSQKKTEPPPKKVKPRKEINIQDVVRERREAEDAAAKQDEETLRQTLEGVDVEGMKNLAVVEEMDIPERTERPRRGTSSEQASDRWDERWNGRKNFKKFRRRGQDNLTRRARAVIVPLEELKKKDYGIGDEYWVDSEKSKKKRKEKERVSQSQSQPFTAVRTRMEEIPEVLVMGEDSEVIDIESPRTTRSKDKTTQSEQSTGQSKATSKRPAPVQAAGSKAKRQKLVAPRQSDSDSEDELKFRLRKRK